MPFTLGGDWVPSPEEKKAPSGKPVKVRREKRKQAILTVVHNLERDDIKEIARKIKTQLGCGGSVKEGKIEIQGDKVSDVEKILREMGIKPC